MNKHWNKEETGIVLFGGDYNVNSRLEGYDTDVLNRFEWMDKAIYFDEEKKIFSEYETFLNLMKLEEENPIYDLLELTCPMEKPVTYCEANHNEYGELENFNKVLTCENEKQNQCLDYFLLLDPLHLPSNKKRMKVNEDYTLECEVNKFHTTEEIFQMLSDHYGIEMKMRIF